MKKITNTLIIFLIPIIFCNCSDEINTPSFNNSFTVLSGNVEDWIYGDSLILKAEIFDPVYFKNIAVDSCKIKPDGFFSIKLNTPGDSMLSIFEMTWDTSCTGDVIVNPPNSRASSFLSLNIYFNYMDTLFGRISRYNPRDSIYWTRPGDFDVMYIYANNSGSVTGTKICPYSWFLRDTTIFDVACIKGWNKIVINYYSYSSSSGKRKINTIEPLGGKWYLRTYNSKKHFNTNNKLLFY